MTKDFAGATCFLPPPPPFAFVSSEYRGTERLRSTTAEGVSVPPTQFLADFVCGVPAGVLRSRKKIFRRHLAKINALETQGPCDQGRKA